MIVYKDNRPATVISGNRTLVKFKGETAGVPEDIAKILERIGYRVEKPDEKGKGENDTGGTTETPPPDSAGAGDPPASGNGKKRN